MSSRSGENLVVVKRFRFFFFGVLVFVSFIGFVLFINKVIKLIKVFLVSFRVG